MRSSSFYHAVALAFTLRVPRSNGSIWQFERGLPQECAGVATKPATSRGVWLEFSAIIASLEAMI
jgi:hypothetical protein